LGRDVTFGRGWTGYLAEAAGPGPGVVVAHDWYGLLPSVRTACDALAGAGLTALAPDFYAGRTTTDPGEAEALMDKLDVPEARAELTAAIAELRDRRPGRAAAIAELRDRGPGRVGALGWSAGGWLTLLHATGGGLDAVVAYYAALAPSDRDTITCPVLLHLAEVDDWDPPNTPVAFLAELARAGTVAEVTTWPGTEHSFANPDAAPYEPDAAARAWAQTVDFLHRHLD
jgi:carboxymethylenebutenolidase